eukprot:CAMPEP_0113889680 /NCGR_PEP_ID=MMETSP0780_2-20120614/13656_1 /TAXON_ID=652834 /ORGANISM="Palpitomonas bilix" /LENGTH=83 /DNA_ID=CAMNT_0000878855 /DNA_START=20 /DNA_END=271 /DNA_ORIENTATION=- /assembly_acc=CAM_ASM_000599
MSGLKKILSVTPQLARVIGTNKASRIDTTRLLWKYIKEKGLQDEDDKRYVLSGRDAALYDVFKTSRVHMLEIPKALNQHFHKE